MSLIPSSPISGSGLSGIPTNPGALAKFALDKLRGLTGSAGGVSKPGLPWSNQKSTFFNYITIQPSYWDQLFPYRLVVIDVANGNKIVGGSAPSSVTVRQGSGNTVVEFTPLGNQWILTLPISPQQLTITDQFAINTSATLRGVLEEHGGLKFKMISLSGTMGVWPYRSSITDPPSSPSVLQSFFGGTIQAAQNFLGQVQRVINVATSNHPASKPVTKRPEDLDPTSTGYYQALALEQFLEQYAEAKKDPKNASWRLIFDIPKQNQSFVVTPLPFMWSQNVNKPMEIQYQLQFKAWRRIDLKQPISPTRPSVSTITPGILQRVLNTISEARRSASSALNLIGAVRSDIEAPLEVLRQTSLFVKDLAGIATTVADLPFQIQRDYASSIKNSINILKDSINSVTTSQSVKDAVVAIAASTVVAEGLSATAVAGGQLGTEASIAQTIDPSNNVFQNPAANFELMNQVPVATLNLNSAQQRQLDNILAQTQQITEDDLRKFRGTVLDLALQLSNNFGTGDAYYSKVYNRPVPKTRIQPITLDEYELLNNLYNSVQAYDLLTATTEIDDNQKQTNMEYVAGLADQSGIQFDVPVAKIIAPVPFGLNIEEISARYLGDPQRWIEIATLNNLRDPYIDEDGFQRPLLSNASGRQINISNIDNLYVTQRVVLKSSTQLATARRILNIERLSDTNFLITLDGLANLDNFTTIDSAYLQAYLPGTVNSQQKIYIPSDLTPPSDLSIINPASTLSDPLTGLSKVDLLLTEKGDIAINNFGDFRFSYGMTNIIQALRLKIGTQKGTILTHPDFGLGVAPGIISSEVNIQDIYDSINKLILDDPRFNGLQKLDINLNGPTMAINMAVNLAGQNGVFPLSFQVQM